MGGGGHTCLKAVAEPVLGRRMHSGQPLWHWKALGAAVRAPAGARAGGMPHSPAQQRMFIAWADTSSTRDRLPAAAWLSRLVGRGCPGET